MDLGAGELYHRALKAGKMEVDSPHNALRIACLVGLLLLLPFAWSRKQMA